MDVNNVRKSAASARGLGPIIFGAEMLDQ